MGNRSHWKWRIEFPLVIGLLVGGVTLFIYSELVSEPSLLYIRYSAAICGTLTFVFILAVLRPHDLTRDGVDTLIVKIFSTLIGASCVTFIVTLCYLLLICWIRPRYIEP